MWSLRGKCILSIQHTTKYHSVYTARTNPLSTLGAMYPSPPHHRHHWVVTHARHECIRTNRVELNHRWPPWAREPPGDPDPNDRTKGISEEQTQSQGRRSGSRRTNATEIRQHAPLVSSTKNNQLTKAEHQHSRWRLVDESLSIRRPRPSMPNSSLSSHSPFEVTESQSPFGVADSKSSSTNEFTADH